MGNWNQNRKISLAPPAVRNCTCNVLKQTQTQTQTHCLPSRLSYKLVVTCTTVCMSAYLLTMKRCTELHRRTEEHKEKDCRNCKIHPSRYLFTYLLTHSLTPWCRILFEKLNVTQLVEKHPAFLWNPKVHYRVHTSPPLDPILSQPNPVRPIDPCLHEVHLNVILPPTRRSSQWSLSFGPPNQNPVNTSPLPHAFHMSLTIINYKIFLAILSGSRSLRAGSKQPPLK
jgi:hypothetical protein